MRLTIVLCALMVATLATMPSALSQSSQQGTSIVALNYYHNAAVGTMTTISFDVTYVAIHTPWLVTAISCDNRGSNCKSVSIDGVGSSPFFCNSTDPFAVRTPFTSGICYLSVSGSGVDFYSYNISFNKTGTYDLTALSQLNYPGDSHSIPGSQSVSQNMTITVN